MAGSQLYEGLKKAVGEIEEGGVSAYGLSSAYMYGLKGVKGDGVDPRFRGEFEEICREYAGADPSSGEIDDSLAANSMLMLGDGEIEELAGRIRGLFEKVAKAEGLA